MDVSSRGSAWTRLRQLVEAVPAGVAVLDREMRYLLVSRRWLSDFRVQESDVIGRGHYEVFPEIPERWKEVHRRCLAGAIERSEEDHFPRADGTVDVVRWEIRPWYEDEGGVGGLVIYSENITERVATQNALRERDARLRLALDVAELGTYELDVKTGRISWDARVRRLWGVGPEEEITLDTLFAGIHPDDREALRATMAGALASDLGGRQEMEYRVVDRLTGELRWIAATALAELEDGRPARVIGTVQDVSARRSAAEALATANQRLREADRRKDEFLATLAHELRTPLAAISNSSHLLERTVPGKERHRRAQEVIARQVTHLSRLIDDLLDVSRITHGRLALQRARLDLNELAALALEDHRPAFERAGIALWLTRAARPLWVSGDRVRLTQVLGNLLHNASKFTPAGGRVHIAVSEDPARREAELRVEDSGRGFPAEALARLFDPFSQLDHTLDRHKGGLGLGLSLVRGLVELHGGSVGATSPGPGHGATFTVRLPTDPTALEGAAPKAPPTPPSSRRVLVIEDNVDAAETLRDLLEVSGQSVALAFSGPEGLETARRLRPDMIICDIGLPGMDGFAVARAVRADPELVRTELVALSGYNRPEDVAASRAAGFTTHLGKPLTLAALERLLRGT